MLDDVYALKLIRQLRVLDESIQKDAVLISALTAFAQTEITVKELLAQRGLNVVNEPPDVIKC